ncbi:hypothetical protein [Roseateles sp.]|uniref:hypothetical protein n=1 Tax=Roseateles sp. TaxID=1971397 RepID=UPI002F40E0E6
MPTPQIPRRPITTALERKAEDVENAKDVESAADAPLAGDVPPPPAVTPPSDDGSSALSALSAIPEGSADSADSADSATGRSVSALSSSVDREAGTGWGVGSLIVGGLVGAVGLAGAFVHSVTNSIVDHYDKGTGKPGAPPSHAPTHDPMTPAATTADDQKVGTPGKTPSRASAMETALKDLAVFDAPPENDVQAIHVTTDPLTVAQVVPHPVL